MKKNHPAVWISVILAAVLFCSAAKWQTTSIKGTVIPRDGASEVWAVSPTETFKATAVDGAFEIKDVRPGTYRLEVKAITPYKDMVKTDIVVTDSQVDVGELKLEK